MNRNSSRQFQWGVENDSVQQRRNTPNRACQNKYLETQVQSPRGLLNTCQSCVCMCGGNLRIVPASAFKLGQVFLSLLNRVAPVGTTPTLHRQIQETGYKTRWVDYKTNKPAHFKETPGHTWQRKRSQMLRSVPALKGLGFRLVKVCRNEKTPNSVWKLTTDQRDNELCDGFVVLNRLELKLTSRSRL